MALLTFWAGITNAGKHSEQAKYSLICQSLGQEEDKKHFKGVTSLNEILSYLKSKYNKPHQLVGSVLKLGYDMKFHGSNSGHQPKKLRCVTRLMLIMLTKFGMW